MDVHVRESEAPGDDPFAELMPEVLPGPEVLPEDGPEVLQAPLSLHHLLDRAKPSLAEAASLAALVLEALADMHDAGCTHGRLDSRSVRLGPGGKVRVAGRRSSAGSKGTIDQEERRADVQAAAGIVAEIDKAAGRPNRALTDREERLSARLAASAEFRSLSRRGLGKAARGLELAVGRADQREAARHGVEGLIRAVAGYDAPAGGTRGAFGGPGNGAPLARRLPPPARRPPLWPRIWKPLAVVAALVVVFGGWMLFFGDKVQRNVETLLSDSAQAAPDPKRPAPLPDLGPPASGPVTHLEVRALDGCRPEGTCNAVMQVAVAPQTTPLEVTWNFELFDRCGSRRESRPGGTASVPPGRDRAVQTVTLALPPGRALTLVPVTTAPARVAGTPMPLFPANRTC